MIDFLKKICKFMHKNEKNQPIDNPVVAEVIEKHVEK